ncbi:MAG: glycerol-3-phosphate dehydrogenase/oxidase, partial [Anaerolineales bacterium]|nr:glycerol-3-phosphate dehydrogenase/oxidase [Anaerolineales bacterium]
MLSREERIRSIKRNPSISVLIVGAGINGIGTFLDLALQGVDVLLIDRGDYCSGASSASSHMVHGGIRYLENGEFRLVREAVRERNRLLQNAPHLVKPLPTTFPTFKWFSGLFNAPFKFLGLLDKPAERGALVIKIGMLFYDFYARDQGTVPTHVFRNKKKSIALFPELNPEIVSTGTYYDGSMEAPERIAIELITDAVELNERAIPLNYMSMVSAEGDKVILRDMIDESTILVQPKVVINAGGPWIDLINRSIGEETEFIGGTKGSHIVLDNPKLRAAIGDHEFFFENEDGRIVLIFPLGDKVLIGTSDIRIENPDQAIITDEEVHGFIDMVGRVFPSIEVDLSQIVYTFSGVRPLAYSQSNPTGQISRDHQIKAIEPDNKIGFPVYSLIGGKWTTYRAFSETISDIVLDHLGVQRRFSTRNYRIGGGKDYPRTKEDLDAFIGAFVSDANIDRDRAEILFSRYGTNATRMLDGAGTGKGRFLRNYPDISIDESTEIRQDLPDQLGGRPTLGTIHNA